MESEYTKDEIKGAERFKNRSDAIEALLKDDRLYTIEEVEEILKEFMEGCV